MEKKLLPVIKLFILLLLSLGSFCPAYAFDVTINWTTWDEGKYVDHFIIYWGTTKGNYTNNTTNIAGNMTSHTIQGLTNGQVFYFAMKSFDATGNSSQYSNVKTSLPLISVPSNNIIINSKNYTSYNISGLAEASSVIEIFESETNSLGTTTADKNGNWAISVNFTSVSEGAISITAASNGNNSPTKSGTYDKTPPVSPTSLRAN